MGKGKGMYLGVKTMERLADVMGGFDSVVSCKTSFFFFFVTCMLRIYTGKIGVRAMNGWTRTDHIA